MNEKKGEWQNPLKKGKKKITNKLWEEEVSIELYFIGPIYTY